MQRDIEAKRVTAEAERLPCVDALRGLMALCVAAYHFSSWTHPFGAGGAPASVIALAGIYSVQGFFIISGLCFFHAYAGRSFTAAEAKRFYVRRFFRIAPLYYGALFLNLGLGRAVWPRFSWGRIFENVSLSFGLFHPNHAMVLGGWSIGIECLFYLAFPALLWLARRRGALLIATLLSCALPFALEPSLSSAPEAARFHAYVRVGNHAFLFMLGALCATLRARLGLRIRAGLLLALASLAALRLGAALPPIYDHFALMHGAPRVYGVAACFALVLAAAFGRVARPALFSPLRWLGELSYALYLLHPFAWLVIEGLDGSARAGPLAFAAGLALSLALAAAAHLLLERPLLSWGKRLGARVAAPRAETVVGAPPRALGGSVRARARAPWLALFLLACDRDEQLCENERCVCGVASRCEITCKAPPCNVECRARSDCEATCANGTCQCGPAARCAFACEAPPCHVQCAGDNAQCDGTCANGTCSCGRDSSCFFTCQSGPCHAECPEGASCVVACPNAPAGTQDCDIVRCAAGAPTICPSGRATTCNAECPPDPGR